MSRLIDETGLMQDLAECTMVAIDRSGTGLKWEDYIKLDDVVTVIKSQPTAHDVEAVVMTLEEKSMLFSLSDRDCIFAIPLNDAIEIVRGGRNEGENK